ncbi:MAG: superoxide dismutase [Fe] [Sulfurospirillum sp.]|nr:MAG: superoxide dismutase [Fe] [Sulfurospirillum sp.]
MIHQLPDLPYDLKALEPLISSETLEYHHGKHHAGYVNKLNALIKGTEYEALSLEEIIHQSDGAIFNNAAQTFNHNFYWHSLSPEPTHPSKALHRAIDETFGSIEKFLDLFTDAAINIFGSGWCWLVVDQHEKLQIRTTSNAHTPLEHHETPLLTCDVWEHAYYIDYRNARANYVETFWKLANWDNASKIFADKEHLKNTGALPPCNDPDDPLCDIIDEMSKENEPTT